MSKLTTVISVRGRDRLALQADPDFAYVGRAMPRQRWRDLGWGNPFKPGMDSDEAIDIMDSIPASDDRARGEPIWSEQDIEPSFDPVGWYRLYVIARRSLYSRLGELRGKTLGCWCCDWSPGQPIVKPCHAIVLAQLADEVAR